MTREDTDWTPMIDLIERVNNDRDLLPSVVAGVSALVHEVSALPPADIAGHTRALLTAATRAIAARRGPTEAELSFVAELGVTRARQGVPVEAVLSAIHVAERAIWARAREAAADQGVGPGLILDARELYDDWAEAVRSRLIKAHREAQAGGAAGPDERDAAILRRLLDGGSAAALAAAEAGLPPNAALWVLTARPGAAHDAGPGGTRAAGRGAALPHGPRDTGDSDRHGAAGRRRVPGTTGPAVSALVDGLLVAVTARAPSTAPPDPPQGPAGGGGAVGVAGPVEAENLAAARRLAVSALAGAEATGRTGPVHAADVAVLAAIKDRTDLAAILLDRHRAAWADLGASGEPVARAVCAWLEARRDVTAAAGRLFVHPNTVRNRVQRFTEVTGIDPSDTFGAVNAWWLCRTWLAPA